MKKNIFKRGFTLIELLVVIAIIGILASVVLASLNSARTKGQDAAIKSSINNMRAQAELYYDDNSNSYTGMCADGTISQALTNVQGQNGGTAPVCQTDGSDWAISSPLVSDSGKHYCVDGSGASKVVGSAASGNACPAS